MAGNLLRRARAEKGLTQRTLASAAGVPQSTIARIESDVQQPSLSLLVLARVDLKPRIALEPYDAHDDVLDATEARVSPAEQEARLQEQDEFFNALKGVNSGDRPSLKPCALLAALDHTREQMEASHAHHVAKSARDL